MTGRVVWWTVLLVAGLLSQVAAGAQVFSQAHNGSGTVYKSAWYPPDGLDGDQYSWDSFTLSASTAITQVQWRGGYTNSQSGAGRAPVQSFDIYIYASIGGNSQPDIVNGRLAHYTVNGNAGETLAGTFGNGQLYDYTYTLTTPFQASAGTVYWLEVYASQGLTQIGWPPDWGFAAGSGGNGTHFTQITGGPTYMAGGDLCFSLWNSDAPTVTIGASVTPAGAGSVAGAGSYPVNSTASLTATANSGFGFQQWTEGGSQVSTNSHYTFTATVNRTLVANFVPAYTITTNALPSFGGITSGGGVYNSGATVTVAAAAAQGFIFADWAEYGTPVSTSATYTFSAAANRDLVAEFVPGPLSEFFDFDTAPYRSPLPLQLSSGYVTANFSATGAGYSIQRADTMGFTPLGMSGLCLYPSSIYGSDLNVSFAQTLTGFSIMFAPQELACDTTATMRVTAYMGGAQVGTATGSAPAPGTWPVGTLAISVPTGFDSVVVHYDHQGTGCQDWGPIFLADNMRVTRLCAAPGVTVQASPASTCSGGAAVFSIAAGGTDPISYQWQYEATPGVFVDLVDGAWDGSAGVGAVVSGSNGPVLSISAASTDGKSLGLVHATQYRCVVSDPCGTATSAPAKLWVNTADFNGDGDVGTDLDIEAFFACLAGNCCATCGSADFNGDGDVGTDADIEAFFRVLAGGAC